MTTLGCSARSTLLFPSIFLRRKSERAGLDDLWGVNLPFDVHSSLIRTSPGMQGHGTALMCAGESRGRRSSGGRSGTLELLSVNGCEDERRFAEGPFRNTRTVPTEAESNINLFSKHEGSGEECVELVFSSGSRRRRRRGSSSLRGESAAITLDTQTTY